MRNEWEHGRALRLSPAPVYSKLRFHSFLTPLHSPRLFPRFLYTLIMYLATPIILYRLAARGLKYRGYFSRWRERYAQWRLPGIETPRRLPGLDVTPELRTIEARAGVEHQHVDALTGQVPGSHAA